MGGDGTYCEKRASRCCRQQNRDESHGVDVAPRRRAACDSARSRFSTQHSELPSVHRSFSRIAFSFLSVDTHAKSICVVPRAEMETRKASSLNQLQYLPNG